MYIYLIVNHITGKYYVGQHKGNNLKKYLQDKFSRAKTYTGSSHLFNSMRKHGREVFTIHALLSDVQTRAELDQHEKDFIAFLKSRDPEYGYNIQRGGEGFTGPHSEKSKEKTRKTWERKRKEEPELLKRLARDAKARLGTSENQAVRTAAWQQSLEKHGGSFHAADTVNKIKQARAQQDEAFRCEKQKEYERLHPERRIRAAATHRGRKHRMSAEGSAAISEAFKKGNRRRWSTHTLVGQTFGRLTVKSQADRSERGLILWNCLCACGNSTVARTDLLRNGHKSSCGCLANEARRRNGSRRACLFLRHGVS
jgi:group I intron endonuclease